jgi:hypothetical protein
LETSCGFVAVVDCVKDGCGAFAGVYNVVFGETQFALCDCSVDFEDAIVGFILIGSEDVEALC